MKIVNIITRLDRGGSTENVLLTVNSLAKKGHECTLIYGRTQDSDVELENEAEKNGVKFIFINDLARSINPWSDFIAFLSLVKILYSLKPDIVHTHSSKAGILGRWAAFLVRVKKIVHTPHGHVFYGYYNQALSRLFVLIERITALITDRLIALTEGEKNETLQLGIGKPKKWVIIHSGVEVSFVNQTEPARLKEELKIPENVSVVGTVARLDPVKGIEYFIQAIKLLQGYKLTFPVYYLIVGDGSEREKLERQAAQYGLDRQVFFAGWRRDTVELISLMDIYVQPSLNEGMGKTLIQAQLCGKPIVATRVGGIPDVVKDNLTGILVPAQDVQTLARAIFCLLKDKTTAESMGMMGRSWVTEKINGFPRFSVQAMVKRTEDVYSSLFD
ncbi:MAG: glycosyltransferase family 4 protein [Elusimicrobiota bacterium]